MAERNRPQGRLKPISIIMGKLNNQNVSGKYQVAEQKLNTRKATMPLNLCGVSQFNVQGLAYTIVVNANRNIILLMCRCQDKSNFCEIDFLFKGNVVQAFPKNFIFCLRQQYIFKLFPVIVRNELGNPR